MSEAALARLESAPPKLVDGAPVCGVESTDGIRLAFDDGFLMLRASGTESLIRVYAEAPDETSLERRLACGGVLLGK